MFANSSEFFDSSQPQSVIVRQQHQSSDNDFNCHSFPAPSSSCLPSTPITPNYPNPYPHVQFPFIFQECFQNFPQFQHFFPQPQDPNCSSQLGNSSLQSPIIGNNALGGSLNPLNNRFPGVGRSGLPYEFPGSSVNFMGGQKPRKGGRRPGEDMVSSDDLDPEEMEKKLKRRQRNKEAAARCRQRRLDLMQSLQEQVSREREQNQMKEKEILSVRQTLEKMVDFLKTHLTHLPDSDRQKFEELMGNLYKDHSSNGGFKSEPIEVPPISDYQPQPTQRTLNKRPASNLPPTSDINILEPPVKHPKIENNQTLTQVNGGMENTAEVSRPTSLDINGLRGGPAPIISTPSNFPLNSFPSFRPPESGGYAPLFGSCDGGNVFLNQSTGLTPSGAPNVGFVAQTPTPLQTSEADLRSL